MNEMRECKREMEAKALDDSIGRAEAYAESFGGVVGAGTEASRIGLIRLREMQKLQLRVTRESALADCQQELTTAVQLNWGRIIDTPKIKELKAIVKQISNEIKSAK